MSEQQVTDKIKAALMADPCRKAEDIAKALGTSTKYVQNISSDLSRRTGSDRRRATKALRSFNKAIDHIFNTCEHMSEVPIPKLTAEQKAVALRRLRETKATLQKFTKNITRKA